MSAGLNEHRAATSRLACDNVGSSIAHHKASRKIDPMLRGCPKNQSRLRLAAITGDPVCLQSSVRVVGTEVKAIKGWATRVDDLRFD